MTSRPQGVERRRCRVAAGSRWLHYCSSAEKANVCLLSEGTVEMKLGAALLLRDQQGATVRRDGRTRDHGQAAAVQRDGPIRSASETS